MQIRRPFVLDIMKMIVRGWKLTSPPQCGMTVVIGRLLFFYVATGPEVNAQNGKNSLENDCILTIYRIKFEVIRYIVMEGNA
ncbi:hypothetical protein CHH67_04300 [Paenibacillus campinasensis]|uniref:Uncharacterized protein n=1 Tax=Paenibacillus campinasensis TaxID=66347 RepID=A0A268F232_9BACL|nr:hypothetical protein CHH67_04300 [Paenibacillus campinasensis]